MLRESPDLPDPAGFANPLPGLVLGDPFVLRHRGRFYLYGTSDGPPPDDGRAIPVFRSDDLVRWEALGGALEPAEPGADHWAPEVLSWNGRFYMVVSFGDVAARGHALWVAEADRPEGPFRLRARVSDPDERFAIDGSWLLDDDGRLYLYHCLDFVEEGDAPHGTGIVVRPMRDPLNPAGPPATVLRAHAPWHRFEADRTMPLYGGRSFAEWTTIEGAAPVKRAGRYFCGYSGGNYAGAYGTGEAVADAPMGPYADLRGAAGPLFGTVPGLVEGPGHFAVVRPDLIHDWIVLHGRRPGESGRRVWLCPAAWDRDGVTIGPLTDRPQPAPPLPIVQSRFSGEPGRGLEGWGFEGGHWATAPGELRQLDPGGGQAWRDVPRLADAWAVEVYIRIPGPGGSRAGLVLDPGLSVGIEAGSPGACFALVDGEGAERTAPPPTLGDEPFNERAFHAIEVRAGRGRAEVRVDGILRFADLPLAAPPARIGLRARGEAAFDALGVGTD